MTPPPPLSSETLHASSVAKDGRAILICGPSGAGKSDLSLQLLDRGFQLVSDDRTVVRRDGERLIASAPARIAGKLEIRGIGIVDVEPVSEVRVSLIVELTGDIERLPDEGRSRPILGVELPMVSVDAKTASAASKVTIALDRFGLPAA